MKPKSTILKKVVACATLALALVGSTEATARSILINFNKDQGTGTSSWGTWNETAQDGKGTAASCSLVFSDGTSGAGTATWTSWGFWSKDRGHTDTFLTGYLDDCFNGGSVEPDITITTPFEFCNVTIYCATDSTASNPKFSYKQVNGVNYTYSNDRVVEGTTAWGDATAVNAQEGKNAITIRKIAGDSIHIVSGQSTSSMDRGSIAAIKIEEVFPVTATADITADTTWADVLASATPTTYDFLRLTSADGATPTITFTTAGNVFSGDKLTFDGSFKVNAADDLYEASGCFGKTLLTGMIEIADGASVTSGAMKQGFSGACVANGSGIYLYAQDAGKEIISINIGGGTSTGDSPAANLVSGSDYYGLWPVPGNSWNNFNAMWQNERTITVSNPSAFNGDTSVTRSTMSLVCKSKNTYGTSANAPFLRGYLDDVGGISVTVSGIPYSKYDVIVYAMSDSAAQLAPFVINGVTNTCDTTGAATPGTTVWGQGQYGTPELGKNAMLITDQTGSTLTITGKRFYQATDGGNGRATLCAVQIFQRGEVTESVYSANITGTTTWNNGNGAGLADHGTFDGLANTVATLTNTVSDATLTLDGTITAARFKFVSEEGNVLRLEKDANATLDIGQYDLTETDENVIFNFDPDFSKVNVGSGYFCLGYTTNDVVNGGYLMGTDNEIAGRKFGETGGAIRAKLGGTGTVTGEMDVYNNSQVTFTGEYEVGSMIGCTHGTLAVAEGAKVSVPHIRAPNTGSDANRAVFNIDGEVLVTSTGTSNVYGERSNYKGILLGHYYGATTMNIGSAGSVVASNCWLQATYTCGTTVTVDGGLLLAKGINGGSRASTFALTNGAVLAVSDGIINGSQMTINAGNATIQNFGSGDWSSAAAITFNDAETGTTIDPNGVTITQSGAISGAGKVNVAAGAVKVAGDATGFTGDIEVASGATVEFAAASGEAKIAGLISGAGSVAKSGESVVTLAAANTFTGATAVNGGTLKVSAPAAGAVSVAAGATLDILYSGVGDGSYRISKGTFTLADGAKLKIAGVEVAVGAGKTYSIQSDAEGYFIKRDKAAASYNGQDYFTMAEAIAAAEKDGAALDTITVIDADAEMPDGYALYKDGETHKIRAAGDVYGKAGTALFDGATEVLTEAGFATKITQGDTLHITNSVQQQIKFDHTVGFDAAVALESADAVVKIGNNGDFALDGEAVTVEKGIFQLDLFSGDAQVKDAAITLGEDGGLENHGWVNFYGDVTIASDSDHSILSNNGSNNAQIRNSDNAKFIKGGAGTITCLAQTQAMPVEVAGGELILRSGATITTLAGDGKLVIPEETTVNANGAVAGHIAGAGTLNLGSSGTIANAQVCGSDWTGAVAVGGTRQNLNTTNYHNGNDSVVRLQGYTGWFSTWDTTEAAPIELVGADAFKNGAFSSNDDKTATFSGIITGSGTFDGGTTGADKNESFKFTGNLSGFTGTFKSATEVNAGKNNRLEFNGAALGEFTVAWANGGEGSNGVVFDYGSDNVEFAGVIASGKLVKKGAGALTLSGANTSSGAVTIEEGAVVVGATGSFGSPSAAVTVSGSGSFETAFGATLNMGGASAEAPAITFADEVSATLDDGTCFNFAVLESGSSLNLKLVAGADSVDATKFSAANIKIGGVRQRGSATFAVESGVLVLKSFTAQSGTGTLTWAGGEGGVWKVNGGGWTSGGAAAWYQEGDNVVFPSAGGTVTAAGTVAPGSVTVSGEWTFTTAAGESATIAPTNGVSATATMTLDSGVTLDYGSGETYIAPGNIAGTGTIKYTSTAGGHAAYVNLAGSPGFTGTVDFAGKFNSANAELNNATLLVLSGGTMHGNAEIKTPVHFKGDYQLGDSTTTTITFSGAVSNAEGTTLTIADVNPVINFAGDNDFAGTLRLAHGTVNFKDGTTTVANYKGLEIAGGGDSAMSISTNATVSFLTDVVIRVTGNGQTPVIVDGTMNVAGNLDFAGDGKTTLNINDGGVVVVGGRLGFGQAWDGDSKGAIVNLNDGGTLVFGSVAQAYNNKNHAEINLNGGVIGTTGDAATWNFDESVVDVTLAADATTVINTGKFVEGEFSETGSTITVQGVIAGAGAVEKTGAGTLKFAGANTFTGATTVSAGTAEIANIDALAASSLVTVKEGATLDLTAAPTAKGKLASGKFKIESGATVLVNGETPKRIVVRGDGLYNTAFFTIRIR